MEKKKRGRPKKEIKKEKAKIKISCKYCSEFDKSKSTCLIDGKEKTMDDPVCGHFNPQDTFHCIRNGQRYNILTCLYRHNCVRYKVRFYLSYGKCRKCPQYKIIKKIANQKGVTPPSVITISRRQVKSTIRRRHKETPKPTIRRRQTDTTIKRREKKPSIKIKRRNQHGKQDK